MRNWILDISLAVLMIWSVGVLASVMFSRAEEKTPVTTSQITEPDETICVLRNGDLEKMTMDDYVTGVLLGELPANFHQEAKKAQAVVARTYALRVSERGAKHGIGVVCGDPGCCQSFVSEAEYRHKWGEEAPILSAKEAVSATKDLVVTYEGELIDATYFSSSGGRTETALAVWGSDVPYLQSVQSPGEAENGDYVKTASFSATEFCDAIGLDLKGSPRSWFGEVTRTEGGGVETMKIGGKTYTGMYLRELLDLRSTDFTVSTVENGVLITCRGFGHRVGMSQYGADAMARQGSDFWQIIQHYYQGVEIVKK